MNPAEAKVLFSSKSIYWETPQELFDELDKEFDFSIDVCADITNFKVERYFNEKDDALVQDWSHEVCWMNPPYGREVIKWVRKAYEESQKGTVVVGLLPVRTDTKWFHEYVYGKAKIRFIKGRLKFGESKNSAPFPSMLVIWGDE